MDMIAKLPKTGRGHILSWSLKMKRLIKMVHTPRLNRWMQGISKIIGF